MPFMAPQCSQQCLYASFVPPVDPSWLPPPPRFMPTMMPSALPTAVAWQPVGSAWCAPLPSAGLGTSAKVRGAGSVADTWLYALGI